ncbi:MAG TPA: tRNA glutamyl-Q(34) synthetase GluQRS, partial [Aliiroseovarius sp.]|nr:tRNA glutamyl-Q(34) synthetase GluQRS [Aliiroseovarius sp.]
DLGALGLEWPAPVLRQSERQDAYAAALGRLSDLGLTYPCSCTRGDIRAALAAPQEGARAAAGPDGPIYPGTCRGRSMHDRHPGDAIRLDMARAVRITGDIVFEETGTEPGKHMKPASQMIEDIGDIVLARRDIGTSYHLAVVVDDSHQAVTHVVRGRDLLGATPIHVLLQRLLGLPVPVYHHHRLIRDENGKRLAKRDDARALATLFAAGLDAAAIRARLGLPPAL